MSPLPPQPTCGAPITGLRLRERALYRKFYQEAHRRLQAEDFLERQRALAHTDYGTTYEENHGRPGFEPALERQLREGASLAELQPLDAAEPALSLWYCLQRRGEVVGPGCTTRGVMTEAARKVSPPHCASQPFRRTSAFTTPTHLSLHESPVELQSTTRPRLHALDGPQARGWLPTRGLDWGPTKPRQHRYPLADVCIAEKHWCDRHEDPIRETGS